MEIKNDAVDLILNLIKNNTFSKEEKAFLFWLKDYFSERIPDDDSVIYCMSKQMLKEFVESQSIIRKLRKDVDDLKASVDFSNLCRLIEENTLLKEKIALLLKESEQSAFKVLVNHSIKRLQKLLKK